MVMQLPSPQTVSHKSLIRLLWCNMWFAYLQTAASSEQIKVFLLWTPSLKVFFFLCSINIQDICAPSLWDEDVHWTASLWFHSAELILPQHPQAWRSCVALCRATLHYTVLHCCGDANAAGGIPFLPIATLPPPGSFYTCWGCEKKKCSASLTAVWAAAKEALVWMCTHTF